VGAGRGRSKKAAEQEAARVALELLDTDADAAEELAEGEGVGSCT
jgi:dsRNA-specific ribonuclease